MKIITVYFCQVKKKITFPLTHKHQQASDYGILVSSRITVRLRVLLNYLNYDRVFKVFSQNKVIYLQGRQF